MRSLKRLFLASAALACLGAAQAIAAGPPDPYPDPGFSVDIIGGGSTFPSIVYRQMLDCQFHPLGYGSVTGPGPMTINSNCPSAPYGEAAGNGAIGLWYYYAPTGSANGKAAIKANDNTVLASPIVTTIPYTASFPNEPPQYPTYPYPQAAGYHFTASEDVWNLADQTAWNAPGGPASKYGNLVQLPGVAGAVAIVLNGNDGTPNGGNALSQHGAAVTGSSSSINFTRQALCGIFSGHITKWNNAILTAQNSGVAMGTGQITVVHRPDGSGTNFLLTNALQEQCRAVTGPNNETDATVVSYAFPWGDHSVCPAFPRGSNQVNWPDQFPSICGGTNNNHAPAGSVFASSGVNGSQALVNAVTATPGAIGYVSPDFTRMAPTNPTGPITANLQNERDVRTNGSGTPTFVAPTVAATDAAMSSIIPILSPIGTTVTNGTLGNPLAWSLQGVVPNPPLKGAYPIAGFSWVLMYQCYNSPNNIPAQLNSFLYSLYAGGALGAIINSNGFSVVPNVWQTQVFNLLGNANFAPSNLDAHSCSGKVGAT